MDLDTKTKNEVNSGFDSIELIINDININAESISKLKILYALWDIEYGTIQQLMDITSLSRQNLQYHLKQLINEGTILRYENKYYLQPVLTEIESVMQYLQPFITFIAEFMDYSQCDDPESAVKNTVMTFLYRLTIQIDENGINNNNNLS